MPHLETAAPLDFEALPKIEVPIFTPYLNHKPPLAGLHKLKTFKPWVLN